MVAVTGLDALGAAGAAGEGADDTGVSLLVEVLSAGTGALIILAVVFGSPMALVPLLMAAVAVPATLLVAWPLAAVVEGIGRTGRLVTSAALILGLAVVALSASPGTEVKIFATALAAGILIDATIVRAMLVPAVVAILGRWWLPSRPGGMLRVKPSLIRAEPAAEEI